MKIKKENNKFPEKQNVENKYQASQRHLTENVQFILKRFCLFKVNYV